MIELLAIGIAVVDSIAEMKDDVNAGGAYASILDDAALLLSDAFILQPPFAAPQDVRECFLAEASGEIAITGRGALDFNDKSCSARSLLATL